MRMAGFLTSILLTTSVTSAAVVTVPLSDFVMFSGGGLSVSGGNETSIGGHTLVNGNVGSNQDLFMQGNPLPGYPAQLNGSAYAGGNVTLGQDLTVGSTSGTLREVVANNTASIGGGANIYGNVYANAVSLGSNSGIRKAGGLGGNVEYTTSYSPSSAIVEGSVQSPSTKTFALITMPAATVFTAGGVNQTVPSGNGSVLTLAPGTYGSLATSAQNQTVTLSSGNYYFDSIAAQGGFTLKLDLTSGNPVNIYDVGNATFGQGNTLMVKGEGTGGEFVPINLAPELAALVYLETYGRFVMSGSTPGSPNIWGGTVYASMLESGSAEVSIGQYMNWYGAIFALDTVDVADHGTWTHVPAVPEPVTLSLLTLGGLVMLRRARRQQNQGA